MAIDGTKTDTLNVSSTSDAQNRDKSAVNQLSSAIPVKQKKTADELAAMIREDLSKMEGCPTRGVNVTVYGCSPWNSMLLFGVDAGPVPNKADLQSLCDIITERLKRLYDV